jgi:hypothetical protein
MAGVKDIIRGDTRVINVTVTNSDGSAKNITGATVWFTANATKDPSSDATAAIQKIVTTHTNPTGGLTTIVLTGTDTNVAAGTYYYDIQVKDSSGNFISSKQGKFKIKPDTTRSTT